MPAWSLVRITLIAALVVVSAIPFPAAADGYAWTNPSTGAMCYGGDTGGQTLGQWMRADYPAIWRSLNSNSQLLSDHVYNGTTCTTSSNGGATPAPPSIDPSGSGYTAPFGYCPQSQVQQAGGCISAFTTLNTTYTFGGAFNMTVQDVLEADDYTATDSWAPLGTNFHDNHGGSWGMSISGYQTTAHDPNTSQAYTQTGTEASGTGIYQWLVLTCSVIVCYPDVATSVANFQTESVHVGYEATDNRSNGGSGNYCWNTDYTAASAGVIGGGWCATP